MQQECIKLIKCSLLKQLMAFTPDRHINNQDLHMFVLFFISLDNVFFAIWEKILKLSVGDGKSQLSDSRDSLS